MSKHRIVAEYRPTDKMTVTIESESTAGDNPETLGANAALVCKAFEDTLFPIDFAPFEKADPSFDASDVPTPRMYVEGDA